MSNVRIWIHAVWGTKYRRPLLTKEIRSLVIGHIRENAELKKIFIDKIGGYTDHLHCLFRLDAEMSIAKTMQFLKGESSHWINKEKIIPVGFEWANEYYAISVSDSAVETVRAYIEHQEEHHAKNAFAEEFAELVRVNSLKSDV
jgi:putative transposase